MKVRNLQIHIFFIYTSFCVTIFVAMSMVQSIYMKLIFLKKLFWDFHILNLFCFP